MSHSSWEEMEFSDYGLAMDSWKVEEECAPRDPQCSGANAQRLKDVVGQHGDVTGKNFKKGGDREISSNDLPLHRPEHSMAIKTQERNCTDVVLDNAYLDPGVQESDLNHVEEDPDDQVEEILLLFSDSDSDASEGCVKLEEECVDIDDSPDEDQGEVIPQFHHLPMPVPTTSVTPVRSPLQKKFPHLCLPSSHPLHLLEPVGDFQPRSQLVAALTELGITSKAAIKALFWTGNLCVQTAADWCFNNPGRELLSLEEEVQMWLRDLEIQEEELTRWEEVVREWRMEEEAKAWQAAQVKRLMEQAEANRGIEMFRAMQNKATLVEVVDISGKEEITSVEGEQSAIVGPKVLYSREVVMDISDDSEEDYLFIPRVVLFVNSEVIMQNDHHHIPNITLFYTRHIYAGMVCCM